MAVTKEYETITLYGIKLDVHYSVFCEGGIQLESVESLTDTQDLMPIMNQNLFDTIVDMLKEIERKKG